MSLSLCLCIQPHARVSLVDQLLEKLGQVAETMRLCANVADDFARTMSGKTLNPGVNPFSDVVSSVGQKTGKRKAQTLDDDDDDDAQEGKKKKRAPRKPKDPNAPKRPPSSYLMFQNDVRAELKSKFPELPNRELLQMISKRWAAMSDEDKEVRLVSSIAPTYSHPAGHRCTANKMPLRRRHTQRRRPSTTLLTVLSLPLPLLLLSRPLWYVFPLASP
jgi:hypothetical protein